MTDRIDRLTRIKFSSVNIPSYEEIQVRTVFADINNKLKFESLKEILRIKKTKNVK